jgi:1,4-dihydroxy-2-naphthoate octaprenyltransferase
MTLRKLIAFIQLTRPLFLMGGVVLYALGVFIARSQGITIDLPRALLGQAIITSIQLMTHYSNEYYDLETDRLIGADRTFFSGGSGVLPSGTLSPVVAQRAMRGCAAVGLVAIFIGATQSPLVGLIGIIGLLGAYFYSAPPLRLSGSGWGELTASIIVALLTPLTGYVLQTNRIDPIVFQIAAPLVLLHLAMVLTFELPDYAADLATHKRTLAVRSSRNTVGWLHTALIIGAFVFIAITATSFTRFVWLSLPLAVWQIGGAIWRSQHAWIHLGWFTFGGLALFALTASLWLIGFSL